VLPPTPASTASETIAFVFPDGSTFALRDVLFGDVMLCGGQSNMQYTPRSMAGMNNQSAEIAAADAYAHIRFFTVGEGTDCNRKDCSAPFRELDANVTQFPNGTCYSGHSCRDPWAVASAGWLGAQAWNSFSAVCWLFGRDIHDALGGTVPIGLISSNWGGTPVQVSARCFALSLSLTTAPASATTSLSARLVSPPCRCGNPPSRPRSARRGQRAAASSTTR
jgi:sialate O-acetylesterase